METYDSIKFEKAYTGPYMDNLRSKGYNVIYMHHASELVNPFENEKQNENIDLLISDDRRGTKTVSLKGRHPRKDGNAYTDILFEVYCSHNKNKAGSLLYGKEDEMHYLIPTQKHEIEWHDGYGRCVRKETIMINGFKLLMNLWKEPLLKLYNSREIQEGIKDLLNSRDNILKIIVNSVPIIPNATNRYHITLTKTPGIKHTKYGDEKTITIGMCVSLDSLRYIKDGLKLTNSITPIPAIPEIYGLDRALRDN